MKQQLHWLPAPTPLWVAALLLTGPAALAQNIGIGTTSPNSKAALDISATDKGLLVPRLTQAQRLAIASPPQGLMVYQTDGTASGGSQTGFWYYAGSPATWVYLNPTGAPSGTAGGDLTGTYPNPTVTTGAIGTAKLADNAVTNSKVADDAIGLAELSATGTPSSSTYLRGDNTWASLTSSAWGLSGNSTDGNQFLGTTNDQDFIVKRNNTEAFRIRSNGGVTLGNNSPSSLSVMLGFNAGVGLTTATQNTFVGAKAGEASNTSQNTYIGYMAGQNLTSSANTVLGAGAGSRGSGANNVFIGAGAGSNSSATPTGSGNIVVGVSAGTALTSNSNNILLGGSTQADAGLYDAYAIGNNATVSQGNSLAIGNVRGTNDAISVGIGTATPNSTLQVNGTFAVGVVAGFGGGTSGSPNGFEQGSTNTTIIGGYYGLAPGSSSNYYQLPNPTACPGRVYYLRNNSSSTSAFLLTTGGSIYGASSSAAVSSTTGYEMKPSVASKTVIAISDGTNWTVGYIN